MQKKCDLMPVISVFLYSVLLWMHPLHISVTEITYDKNENELEIMIRVFRDDLELAIQTEKKDNNVSLLKEGVTDLLSQEYLRSKFKISIDGEAQPVKYLGHETDEDVVIFYVQAQPVKKFETISITNSIITELYEDQANLVNVSIDNETKSLRLMRNNPSGKLSFEQK